VNKNSDILIIESILKGDRNAFSLLYEKYKRRFLLTCVRYIKRRSEAEDCLQDAFIAIYKDLNKFDSNKGQFYTWANRIVINICLQRLRKKSVLNAFQDIFDYSHSISVDEEAIANLGLQEITKIIQQLPKGYRTVFNMYIIDGYSHKEISDQLGISVGTSKSQLNRAKKLLKTNLDEFSYKLVESYA